MTTRVDEAVKEWSVAEQYRASAMRIASVNGGHSYVTFAWVRNELVARERMRHAVIMAEAGGIP
jgi:hypothetical protein